jgi:hypothetical protein
MRGSRVVVFDQTFDDAVERYGGYERLDIVLAPIVDGLYANPYGYPLVQDDWYALCRYARTKAFEGIPEFIVSFTIEDNGEVVIRDIEEAY